MSDEERGARLAQGLGLMLLAAVLLGALLAVLAMRLHPGPYIAVVIPALCGVAIGAAVGGLRSKFAVVPVWPSVLIAAFGGLVFYLGFEVMVYTRTMSFLSKDGTDIEGLLRRATGSTGFFAYLQLTSEGIARELSPIGLVARLDLGYGGTLAVMAVELVTAVGASVIAMLKRSSHVGRVVMVEEHADGPRTREVLVRTDEETLLSAMQAMERGDFETAGQILTNPSPEDTHGLAVSYVPHSTAPWKLEILEIDAGQERVRATREISSWEGHALQDELRTRR